MPYFSLFAAQDDFIRFLFIIMPISDDNLNFAFFGFFRFL